MRRRWIGGCAAAILAAAGCGRAEMKQSVYFSLPTTPDRTASTLNVKVMTGFCSGEESAPRLETPRIRTEPTAFIVSFVQVQEVAGEICKGIGSVTMARLELPEPLGDRALVADAGPANFQRILVPPRGRGAIRELGLRDGFAYIGSACDAVAKDLEDRPKDEWCLY